MNKTFKIQTHFAVWLAVIFCICLAPPSVVQAQAGTDYCSLFEADTSERVVETVALLAVPEGGSAMIDGGEMFLYLPACNDGDHFSLAAFATPAGSEIVQRRMDALKKAGTRVFRAAVRGRFTSSLLPSFGHLGAFRARFLIDEVSALEEAPPATALPDLKSAAPVIEAAMALTAITEELMSSLRSANVATIKIDSVEGGPELFFGGKRTTLELAVAGIRSKDRADEPSTFTINKLSRTGHEWMAEGAIGRRANGADIEMFSFRSIYKRTPTSGKWELAKLSVESK